MVRALAAMASLAVLLAACGPASSPGNSGGESGASSCGPGDSAPAKADRSAPDQPRPEQPSAPSSTTSEGELFIEGWYRAPGQGAIVQFPELPKGWVLRYEEGKTGRVVTLRSDTALAVFTFAPSHAMDAAKQDLELARGLCAAIQAQIETDLPHLKPTRGAPNLPHDGGYACAQFFEGKSANGVEESAVALVVAQGKDAMLCTFRARKDRFDAAWKDVASPAIESARVGSKVPRLPSLDPGTAVHGIFQGPTKFDFSNASRNRYYWLVMDRRGWFHEVSPRTERELDCEAMYQFKPSAVGRYVIKGDEIEWQDANGRRTGAHKLSITEKHMMLGGERWDRVDRTGGLTLEVAYEAVTFYINSGFGETFTFSSSKTYYFTKNGKFSFDSFAAAQSADDGVFPPPSGFRSWASAHSERPTSHGNYKVEGNLLLLAFADGRRAAKTLFLSEGKDVGLLFIGGSPYLSK